MDFIRVVLDFETYWSSDFTLSKMTTEAYVRDPRFKAHMVGVQVNDKPYIAIGDKAIRQLFKAIPWERSAVIMQHGQFDGLILSHHYGVKPAFMCDTLSMFRALYPAESASLANIARVLNLPDKGSKGADVMATKGKEFLSAEEAKRHGEYCLLDVELTRMAFDIMAPQFTASELRLIDLTLKMFTDPVMKLNSAVLQDAWEDERQRMLEMFIRAMPDKAEAARHAVLENDAEAWRVLQTPLSSNPQFAQILLSMGVDPPKKISPAKAKSLAAQGEVADAGDAPIGLIPAGSAWSYAFAKSDDEFKRLLEHEDESVQALVEARIGVKSRIKETRAKRFIDMASRGDATVYLIYAGAHTLRWSGGGGTNFQNLPRGSKLRESIEAPEGHVLCVQDLSAIEARVLAWLAGQEDVVEQFRKGEDVYCEMASSIFGRVIDKSMKLERFLGKAVTLGCFGPDTLVLTSSGWKPIVSVLGTDTVWDGEDWVCHSGVIAQGVKETLTYAGVEATASHEILTEHGWREWQEVITNSSLMKSALNKAHLPSSGGTLQPLKRDGMQDTTLSLNATADGKASLTAKTSPSNVLPDAIHAAEPKEQPAAKCIGAMKVSSPTPNIEPDYSTGSRHALADATPRPTNNTRTMGGEASTYLSSGGLIGRSFSNTLSHSQDGMTQAENSIGSTTTEGTNLITYDSLLEAKTLQIKDKLEHYKAESKPLKRKMQTYDIALAGPRSRFTILTSKGPLIVHNCGYGLGWKKFESMLRIGMLGNPPLLLGEDIAEALGINPAGFEVKQMNYLRENQPPNLTAWKYTLHCACAFEILNLFRDNRPAITGFWDTCTRALDSIMRGEEFCFGRHGIVKTCKEGLMMPSGMILRYVELEPKRVGKRIEYSKLNNRKRGERSKVYGGLVTENIVQRLARDIIAANMLTISKKYRIATMTHDEIVCVVPEDNAEECCQYMNRVMCTPPKWAFDLPLGAEGGYARNYTK